MLVDVVEVVALEPVVLEAIESAGRSGRVLFVEVSGGCEATGETAARLRHYIYATTTLLERVHQLVVRGDGCGEGRGCI